MKIVRFGEYDYYWYIIEMYLDPPHSLAEMQEIA
jgi:hypothetical protein